MPLSRRDVLGGALAGATLLAVSPALAGDKTDPGGPLTLAPLPYPDTALAPVISQNTLSFHYGKHHKAYVDNGNKALVGSPLAAMPVAQILKETAGKADKTAIFNNVAQAWNHEFYWKSMKPNGGGAPTGKVLDRINTDLGGYDAFKAAFLQLAKDRFGSGWVWLVATNGKLSITSTANADNPITSGATPLLVCDVWEHAYYLDYQNKRADYVTAWLEKLVNWETAAAALG